MAGKIRKCKCRHCRKYFRPDHRNAKRQKYCGTPECRKASKAASQRTWLNKPENRDQFKGSTEVKRVQRWRSKNPGYWRRKEPEGALQDRLQVKTTEEQAHARQLGDPGQEALIAQTSGKQPYASRTNEITDQALQDSLFSKTTEEQLDLMQFGSSVPQGSFLHQHPIIVGLISHLTGYALQDHIASFILGMQKLGSDILHPPTSEGGRHDDKQTPHRSARPPNTPWF